jgi:L-seryl-tRNA(Ser) seleniumtransferase
MSAPTLQSILRALPNMDALLRIPEVVALQSSFGREKVAQALRAMVEDLRKELMQAGGASAVLEGWTLDLPARLAGRLRDDLESSLRPVINATGVLVHTNLGRSPLAPAAIQRLAAVGSSYTTLEYDLEKGSRGSRSVHAQRLFGKLFPGWATHVVNNNAAAVLLALNTLAEGREVIVSRGELVEIGGSFRIPDVMRKGQAVLKEVGSTNRTRLADYENAIDANTALLLKVHTSNYRIVGFTAQVSLAELAELGRRRNLPVLVDQGSGNLLDLAPRGIGDEPPVAALLAQGADLVTFSGDKLLGGPQSGILVGRGDLIARIRKNPLSRALRVDKLTYAALEATLESYVRGRAKEELPVLSMMDESAESVQERALRCAARIQQLGGDAIQTEILPGASLVGGGAAPTEEIPTRLLAISCPGKSAAGLETALRSGTPPVVGRIQEDRLVLDLRTVLAGQEEDLARAVAALAGELKR